MIPARTDFRCRGPAFHLWVRVPEAAAEKARDICGAVVDSEAGAGRIATCFSYIGGHEIVNMRFQNDLTLIGIPTNFTNFKSEATQRPACRAPDFPARPLAAAGMFTGQIGPASRRPRAAVCAPKQSAWITPPTGGGTL